MKRRLKHACLLAAVAAGVSCAAGGTAGGLEPSAEARQRLAEAPVTLRVLASQMGGLEREWKVQLDRLSDKTYSQVTSGETDSLEGLLFRYLVCRESLWDVLGFFAEYEKHYASEEDQTRAFAAAFHAAALLSRHSAWLVLRAMDEKAVARKLNEAHYRYNIPAGTFDMLFYSLTSPKNLGELASAKRAFATAATEAGSMLSRLAESDPAFSAQLAQTAWLWIQADELTQDVLRKRAIALPEVENLLRQNELMEQARKAQRKVAEGLYVAQGLLYSTVSDFKRPLARPLAFSAEQVEEVKRKLQPGDLILTFTSGYMSNVFLPGRFKHGITFVGTPEQRRQAGLGGRSLEGVPDGKRQKLARDLAVDKLPTGEDADVIEAVAEGVIFNSIELLLRTHVNRLAVLRPRLTPEERAQALANTFLLLGCQYDFNFDFVDASYQCCTEVIYRSFDKRGGIAFSLSPRAGVQTLTADDIILYYLNTNPGAFEFIMLAEESRAGRSGGAQLLAASAGASRLRELMSESLLPETMFTLPKISANLPSLLPKF